MVKEKDKKMFEELKVIMDSFRGILFKFRANLPQILKERQEAEKNRPPRDPLADAW